MSDLWDASSSGAACTRLSQAKMTGNKNDMQLRACSTWPVSAIFALCSLVRSTLAAPRHISPDCNSTDTQHRAGTTCLT